MLELMKTMYGFYKMVEDTGFTLTPRLISPTELELTVTEGTIQRRFYSLYASSIFRY